MTRDHSVILETVRRTDSIGERQLNSYKWEGVKQANTEALIIKQKKIIISSTIQGFVSSLAL